MLYQGIVHSYTKSEIYSNYSIFDLRILREASDHQIFFLPATDSKCTPLDFLIVITIMKIRKSCFYESYCETTVAIA